MEALFVKILNMSIAAGWLVIAVILLRLLLKKAPRAIVCLLWGIVGIRLLLPFSIKSIFSLIPSVETVPKNIEYAKNPAITSGITSINSLVNPVLANSLSPDPSYITSVNPMQIVLFVAAWVWILGMAAMVVYALVSYLVIARKVRESVPLQGNVRICDRIGSPFILGLFLPRIYLPSSIKESDAEYVIAHENAHLARRDHLWKPLGFLLLSFYWFNPLLWAAYILLCRDIEVACDQKVLGSMGADIKKPYSEALINCSVSRRAVAACPLAFGEVSVKSRIQSVLNYKKPAFWMVIIAVVTCVILSVCFLTDPMDKTERATELQDPYGVTLLSDDAQAVRFIYGEYSYEVPYSREIVSELDGIRVYAEPIDTITTEPIFTPFYAIYIDGGNLLCFNHDLTECWINGNVRPYSVYRIANEDHVKKLFSQYVPTLDSSHFDNSTGMSGTVEGNVRYFYATVVGFQGDGIEYVEVLPAKGTLEETYVESGETILVYTALASAHFPELKIGDAICVTYHGIVNRTPFTLYCQTITKLGQNTGLTEQSKFFIPHGEAVWHDIDRDGIIEQCSLGPGLTSGIASFTMTASDGQNQKYHNSFISSAYSSLSLVTFADKLYVQCVLLILGKVDDDQPVAYDLFEVSVANGNIVLTKVEFEIDAEGNCAEIGLKKGENLAYWEDQKATN